MGVRGPRHDGEYFNSRPCARGDVGYFMGIRGFCYFNSRPCARGDLFCPPFANAASNFNSRPCARGDVCLGFHRRRAVEFQFPPLREGRLHRPVGRVAGVRISIPAPARGATNRGSKTARSFGYFNSRPCARGDGGLPFFDDTHHLFQFPPLREGRPLWHDSPR